MLSAIIKKSILFGTYLVYKLSSYCLKRMVGSTLLTYTQKSILLISLVFIFSYKAIDGHPVKSPMPNDLEGKEETRLANGTIVGKYVYKDANGTPVHVKYFADKRGYGVELKSMKIDVSNSGSQTLMTHLNMKMQTAGKPFDLDDNDIDSKIQPNVIKKSIHNKPKDKSSFMNYNAEPYFRPEFKMKPDYEIFIEDASTAPANKCDKDKVKVYNYIEHSKRKTRNIYPVDETLQYCSNN